MQLAVELPAGEDLNEWLAVNTIEFYNEINVLYGILMEFCTCESCPRINRLQGSCPVNIIYEPGATASQAPFLCP